MSLVRAVVLGTLVGAVAALAIFVSIGPDDLGRAAVPAAPTFAPVPTPTVTELADCTPPAVLKKGVCVTTKPGPKLVVPDPVSRRAPTTAARTAPDPGVSDDQQEHDDDHGDDDGDDDHEGDDHDDDDDD